MKLKVEIEPEPNAIYDWRLRTVEAMATALKEDMDVRAFRIQSDEVDPLYMSWKREGEKG